MRCGACRVVFWVQHGAITEERTAGGGLAFRRCESAPDSFADGAAICDSDDEELAPSAPQRAEPEHRCKQFLQVCMRAATSDALSRAMF